MIRHQEINVSLLCPKWLANRLNGKKFPKCGVSYGHDKGYGIVLVKPGLNNPKLVAAKIQAAAVRGVRGVYVCRLNIPMLTDAL